jgi:peptide deformylase
MRRTIVLLATMVLTLLVASGVALAAVKVGTNGPDFLIGTKGSDVLSSRGAAILSMAAPART